jgi:hypothetical protein
MEKKEYINHWKRYHDSLTEGLGKRFKQQIEKVLCISQSAFYRKLKSPDRFLTIAEKQAIARVYKLEESYLFPELTEQMNDKDPRTEPENSS